jgi:undecaprenyl phosphate-alpha-L-ara4N flippase subunit ArnF
MNTQADCHNGDSLNNAISTLVSPLRRKLTRQQSIGLVFICTLISASAQILFKIGAQNLPQLGPTAILANPLIALRNVPLLAGLSLYGVFMLVFVFALKDTELSILYPVISFSYVWVALLSYLVFHESITTPKACGITIIMLGVMVLGKDNPR